MGEIRIRRTAIDDVKIVEHSVFEDPRGFFIEVYKQSQFREHGLPDAFVQLNHSRSARHVLRGLHFQWDPPMGKLMRVTEGAAFLVAVDIRPDSPTLGEWVGETFDAQTRNQFWAPAGFARGFCAISEFAQIQYLCTGEYSSSGESGILWNDPSIGIKWPVVKPILSAKDESAQTLADWLKRPEARSFRMRTDK